jgi:glycosyltransferase involved in cell wall biosynthesis
MLKVFEFCVHQPKRTLRRLFVQGLGATASLLAHDNRSDEEAKFARAHSSNLGAAPMSAMFQPEVVSVVIPAYNAEAWIDDCLTSVVNQTYNKLEIIVVDDGSTDGTAQIIKDRFADKVLLIQQANRGTAGATATGFHRASGEFLAFLDNDDLWKPDKIEKQIAHFQAHPDVVAIHTDAEEFSRLGFDHVSYLSRHSALRDCQDLMEAMLRRAIPLKSTVMLRRSFLARHAITLDSEAGGVEDIGLFMEIVGRGGRFDLMDEVTTYRRMHGANLSSNHLRRFARRVPMYERLLARCADCDEKWKARVRLALSDAEFRVGEHHWGQGNRREARQHFHGALKAWPGNKQARLANLYTLLPSPVSGALRKIKRYISRDATLSSGG